MIYSGVVPEALEIKRPDEFDVCIEHDGMISGFVHKMFGAVNCMWKCWGRVAGGGGGGGWSWGSGGLDPL